MASIKQLQNIVNRFDQLTETQKTEALICFKKIIENISNEEVKTFFKEFLLVLEQ